MCYHAFAMKCEIILEDKLNNQRIYEGDGNIHSISNGIEILFADDVYSYHWKVYEKGLIITNQSEVLVRLTFKENKRTKGHIETEFGEIDLEVETLKYRHHHKSVEIRYDLVQNEQRQSFHFVLYLSEEDLNGIH